MISGDYTEDLSAAQRQDQGESYEKRFIGWVIFIAFSILTSKEL